MSKKPPIYAELARLLAKKSGERLDGGVASNRTRALAHETMFGFIRALHGAGLMVQNLRNLNATHAEFLAKSWVEDGLAPATIRHYKSTLRKLYIWLNKPDAMVKVETYLKTVDPDRLRVHVAADTSKAWSEHGVDVHQAIMNADRLDPRFGLMLRMMAAFGLRRSEVLQCKPWIADRGTALRVFPGEAKGGRPREIPIESEWQRKILDDVKACTAKTEDLGWQDMPGGQSIAPGKRLAYCKARYTRCMRTIGITKSTAGVTGHGLRAEYAENIAMLSGVTPPTLGGGRDQMPNDELQAKLRHVSENLGHSRTSVTASYYGSFRKEPKKPNHKAMQARTEKL